MGRRLCGSPVLDGAIGTTSTSPATSAHISQCAGGVAGQNSGSEIHTSSNVVDTEVGMLQMCRSRVDFKRVVVVKLFEVQAWVAHRNSCSRFDYAHP